MISSSAEPGVAILKKILQRLFQLELSSRNFNFATGRWEQKLIVVI